MRVMIVIAAIARGGMERQIISLGDAMCAGGHAVHIVAQKAVHDYQEELREAGVGYSELHCDSAFDLRVLPRLITSIKAFRPDVVICENFNATLWGRLAAVLSRVPVVTAEHTTDRALKKKIIVTNRLLAPVTAAVVGCAHAQVDFLVTEGNRRESIRVIHNGVDPARFAADPDGGRAVREALGVPSSSVLVGLMAAHRPEKCHERFYRLVDMLAERGHDVFGIDVGGGPLLEVNRERAARSKAAARIRVLGPRADVAQVYSAMDACVFVSEIETFPMAALEAQACSVPVFALAAGGLDEAIMGGVTGAVVAQGALDELVEQLDSAIRRGSLGQMGEDARTWVSDNFTVQRMTDEFVSLLSEIVGE